MSKELVQKTFAVFGSVYGHLWTSRANDSEMWKTTLQFWTEALSKFDPQCVAMAAKNVASEYIDHPPTLGQFISLCKKIKNDTRQLTADAQRDEKIKSLEDLSNLEGESEVAKRELSKIRMIISGKKVPKDEGEAILELREWPEERINKHSKKYNATIAKARLDWLCAIPEHLATQLPVSDRFDRTRELSFRYSKRWVRDQQDEVEVNQTMKNSKTTYSEYRAND